LKEQPGQLTGLMIYIFLTTIHAVEVSMKILVLVGGNSAAICPGA
jgi:hypothetical protein